MSKVDLVNTPEAIRSVIANIGAKATAYKSTVSSAVLSATQHYRAHGDYTLLQEAMDAVFEINYRDYSAVVKFVQDLTWVGLTMANRGRRQHYEIVGDMVAALGQKPSTDTIKDWNEKTKRVREQMVKREGLFDSFANGKEIPMKNPDWTTGMDKELKQQGVVYNGDIFAWHDDVQWLRNTGSAGTGSESTQLRTLSQEAYQKLAAGFEDKIMNSVNKPVIQTVIHILDRFESEREVFATDEELEELQATVNLFVRHTKARSDVKRERDAAAASETANANEEAITPPSEQENA